VNCELLEAEYLVKQEIDKHIAIAAMCEEKKLKDDHYTIAAALTLVLEHAQRNEDVS